MLELFKAGDVVEKHEGHEPLIPLHTGINSTERKASGWPNLRLKNSRGQYYDNWKQKDVPQVWLVLNASWDPMYCHLWIELISMDGTLRGWLKDPQEHVQKIKL